MRNGMRMKMGKRESFLALFRGKEVSGIWGYGNLTISQQKMCNVDVGAYISNSMGLPFAYKVIPETVGQFTGLKDKDGVKIYEGDIVAKFDFEDPCFRSTVVWHLGAFGYKDLGDFIAFASNYHFKWDNNQSNKISVVGNIHENPETLRKELEEDMEAVVPDSYHSLYGAEPGEDI